jgi:hypothetical protein
MTLTVESFRDPQIAVCPRLTKKLLSQRLSVELRYVAGGTQKLAHVNI